jgi:hypothetical protein
MFGLPGGIHEYLVIEARQNLRLVRSCWPNDYAPRSLPRWAAADTARPRRDSCSEETAVGCIVARVRRGNSPSDATAEVYRRQRVVAQASVIPHNAVHNLVHTGADRPVHLKPAPAAVHHKNIIAARILGMQEGFAGIA